MSHVVSRSLSPCVISVQCFILNVFCHLTDFAAFSHLFSPLSSFPQVFCPFLLYANHCVLFFWLESTNNVWSSHHQGCCHGVTMATSSPRSNSHCGENGEAETESTHRRTDKHTHTHTTVAPHHMGNPYSFAITASGSVKVIIDLPSQSQRS